MEIALFLCDFRLMIGSAELLVVLDNIKRIQQDLIVYSRTCGDRVLLGCVSDV